MLKTLKDSYSTRHYCKVGLFSYRGVEEITLLSTLRKISQMTLADCSSLRAVYVKSGCQADLSHVTSSVEIVQLQSEDGAPEQ